MCLSLFHSPSHSLPLSFSTNQWKKYRVRINNTKKSLFLLHTYTCKLWLFFCGFPKEKMKLAQAEKIQDENVNTDSFMIQKHLPHQYTELLFYLCFFGGWVFLLWFFVAVVVVCIFMFLSLPFVDLKDKWKVTLQMKMRYPLRLG